MGPVEARRSRVPKAWPSQPGGPWGYRRGGPTPNRGRILTPWALVPRETMIKSFELTSVEAKRFSRLAERVANIRVENNSTVTLIHDVSEREANVEFRFTSMFVGLGVITIQGVLAYEGDARALAREWTSHNKMPTAVANEIHGAIMNSCMLEAMLLAREVRLPPPIPLPTVQIAEEGKKSSGVEVA